MTDVGHVGHGSPAISTRGARMRWKVPQLQPRFRLTTLAALVALCAVITWAGLFFLSPTRGFIRQMRPDQPAYLRREAAISLGHVPDWEADQAIDALIGALQDP